MENCFLGQNIWTGSKMDPEPKFINKQENTWSCNSIERKFLVQSIVLIYADVTRPEYSPKQQTTTYSLKSDHRVESPPC